MGLEQRRHERQPLAGKVKLHWKTAEGLSYSATGKVLDVSKGGVRLKVDRRLEPDTLVHLESGDLRATGMVRVRHVKPAGLQWEVGLEFTGGLEWRQQEQG